MLTENNKNYIKNRYWNGEDHCHENYKSNFCANCNNLDGVERQIEKSNKNGAKNWILLFFLVISDRAIVKSVAYNMNTHEFLER